MADYKLRPDSYSDGRGPQAGASDLTTAFSGNSHFNTAQENVKSRQGVNMAPTDDAHLTTHRPPETASDDFDYAGNPSNMSIQPGKKSD